MIQKKKDSSRHPNPVIIDTWFDNSCTKLKDEIEKNTKIVSKKKLKGWNWKNIRIFNLATRTRAMYQVVFNNYVS
jgi:hypothetical protein